MPLNDDFIVPGMLAFIACPTSLTISEVAPGSIDLLAIIIDRPLNF